MTSEQPSGENVVPDETVVVAEGADAVVVVEGSDGVAAAVAVDAQQTAEAAGEVALASAAVAVDADAKASESLDVSAITLEELRQMRAENAETRAFIGELYRERQEALAAQQAELENQASVKEVPVNDTAKREAAERGIVTSDNSDSGRTASATAANTSSSKQASRPNANAAQTPARRGLRRLGNRR